RDAAEERCDVVSISSPSYPRVANRYWTMSADNQICRRHGPVVLAARSCTLDDLRGKRVAVCGLWTAGAALLLMYCPDAHIVQSRSDVLGAIHSGDVDAGVIMPGELPAAAQSGLRRVADLGSLWFAETGLPLPISLCLVR